MTPEALDNRIFQLASIACYSGLDGSFRPRAAELGPVGGEDFPHLRWRLHDPVPEPYGHDHRRYGLGGWLSANQFAIFEMIYQSGAEGLGFLRAIAWGVYDWTQGNAIEVLLRLAADGVERDEIIAEVAGEFPGIRYEAQLYTLEPLVGRLEGDPALAAVIEEVAGLCSAFREILDEVSGQAKK